MGLFEFLMEQIFGESSAQKPEPQSQLRRNMKSFKTDLVEASYIRCCCAECAKCRERVYSISGKDKRFPKLPEYLLAGDHDCGIMLFPFIDGVNSLTTRNNKELKGVAIIKHSNRPFVDDRTKAELAELAAAERQEQHRKDYGWLLEHLPDICPKSLSAYSRMKNQNTDKYKAIVEEAKKHGYIIK